MPNPAEIAKIKVALNARISGADMGFLERYVAAAGAVGKVDAQLNGLHVLAAREVEFRSRSFFRPMWFIPAVLRKLLTRRSASTDIEAVQSVPGVSRLHNRQIVIFGVRAASY